MAVYLYAGVAGSAELAKCDACAASLGALPAVRCRRHVRAATEWEGLLQNLCTTWQIQGWGKENEAMVWTASGHLVGNAEDFLMLVEDKYDISLNLDPSHTDDLAAMTRQAADAEMATRGQTAAPPVAGGDEDKVKVLVIKANSAMPLERHVHESSWKKDMDRLLGRDALFSSGVELLNTGKTRIFAWVNNDAEFTERKSTLATMVLGACGGLAQLCFRYAMHGTVVLYQLAKDSATPLHLSMEQFESFFLTPEMETFQQEAAAIRIQSRVQGGKGRKKVAKRRKEQAVVTAELDVAAAKIQARQRGKIRRREMREEADAATVVQSRFRGHAARKQAQAGSKTEAETEAAK